METTVVLSGGAPAMAPDADVGLAPAPAPAGAGAGITLAELATHATPEDAWMAIDGVVSSGGTRNTKQRRRRHMRDSAPAAHASCIHAPSLARTWLIRPLLGRLPPPRHRCTT